MKHRTDLNANEKAFLKNISETLEVDRHFLQGKYPFIGNVLMRLQSEVSENDYPPTAATNGRTMMFNPIFLSGLSEEERQFVLAHEVMHCVMMHMLREKGRDHDLWNIAADLEIHFILTECGMTPPFVLPHEPSWKGLSAEEIYEELQRRIEAARASKSGNDADDGQAKVKGTMSKKGSSSKGIQSQGTVEGTDLPTSFDDIMDREKAEKAGLEDEEAKIDEEELRQELIDKVTQASKVAGTMPAMVDTFFKKLTRRELPWREILAQYITSAYSDSTQWFPPSRRHVWNKLYLPSRHTEKLRCVVGIDTSGSTAEILPKFFTELESLLSTFGKYEVTAIQCDCYITKVDTYTDTTGLPKDGWEAKGFGGTSFRPVFDYVEEHPDLDPACLIYLTDGYGDAPEQPPPYPVLWVISPDGENYCQYGTVINMKRLDD